MASGKFVSYLRVSTDKQGKSGLGLQAQRDAVADYLNGGRWQLVTEFVEVESGKRDDNRPQLTAAIERAKVLKAKLIVAKLDRLSRNVAFTAKLMESGVDFVAVDFPDANKLTVHILAAVAEHEREAISARTKAALAVARDRLAKEGRRLGNPQGAAAFGSKRSGTTKARAALATAYADRVEQLRPVLAELSAENITSVRKVTEALNVRGVPAPRGEVWHKSAVERLLQQLRA
jgi:DNA invertase Pin-like site-specific DNA recombinase